MENNDAKLSVIIIGGSVAGLTLARCLDHAGIDYVLLEKHDDIEANIGGSVGLMPNGSRILDQLGIYSHLEKYVSPILVSFMAFSDGRTYRDSFPTRLLKRFGYPVAIVTRLQLLKTLSASLQGLSKVKTGAKVVRIQCGKTPNAPITVYTENGCQYSGDVVIGADGAHSLTRMEMIRLNRNHCKGKTTKTRQEDAAYGVRAEYMCIFGTSSTFDEITAGEQIIRCYDNLTFLIFPGRHCTVAWFAIIKLERPFIRGESSTWSHEKTAARAKALAHWEIWKNVRFRDLWMQASTISSTPLQEGLLHTWTCNRVICIGDSVSKLTPNIAQGANLAIESAAALANVLHKLKGLEKPSAAVIQYYLDQYAKNHKKRLRGIHRFSSRYVFPWSRQVTYYLIADIISGAVTLDYCPLPHRSTKAWGVSEIVVMKRRMLILLLLLAVVTVSYLTQLQK